MNNTFFKNKKTVLMNVALFMCIVFILGLFLSLSTSLRSENNESVVHTHVYVDGSCIYCELKKVSNGLVFELNESGDSYTVVSYGTCFDTELYIPSSYKGLPVTSVSEYAFKECLWITNVVFPDTVTYIGKFAFYSCKSLKTISFPNSELTIEDRAFYDCDSLIIVTMPEKIKSIGYAFGMCDSLQCINFISASNLMYLSPSIASSASGAKKFGVFSENGSCYFSTHENRYAILSDSEDSSYMIVKKEVEVVASYALYGTVYYEGTEEEWNNIRFSIDSDKTKSNLYFYSETEPTENGNYWHYVDDVPTAW